MNYDVKSFSRIYTNQKNITLIFYHVIFILKMNFISFVENAILLFNIHPENNTLQLMKF